MDRPARQRSREARRKKRFAPDLKEALSGYRRNEQVDVDKAWISLEPTFTNADVLRRWRKLPWSEESPETHFFHDADLLRLQRKIASAMQREFRRRRGQAGGFLFDRVRRRRTYDHWGIRQQELDFQWEDRELESFNVRLGLDPEVFEASLKPVPFVWFYDERFLEFLQALLWDVPARFEMANYVSHGGGQFHASIQVFLQGSLLADDIAYRLDHPELATWILDFPNPDDRAFRATTARRKAYERVLAQYWAGCFHPAAIGTLTPENAYLDRGFDPSPDPHAELIDQRGGPIGTPREVFQANFAFGRTIRLRAQSVHPGYWMAAHPEEDGFRPDQIMRYSEANLNRLQIRGELHVKSGVPLEHEAAPEFDAPLDISMLTQEASWEYRAQMSRTSARDYAEAVLLEMHHVQYLQKHPHPQRRGSLLQDQCLGDAVEVLRRLGKWDLLARLHRSARRTNLRESRGRIKTDWVEPEVLFWAAWRALPRVEQAAIAREVIEGFVERVEQASTLDPRPRAQSDPMEWHRHRVHPLIWKALEAVKLDLDARGVARRELKAWSRNQKRYAARRPKWSPSGAEPPWRAPSSQ